jgi:hypothetical protein
MSADGAIFITYDRERGAGIFCMEDVYKQAREILYARITEEDIIAGGLVHPGSFLKGIVSKLDQYAGCADGLFDGKEQAKKDATANALFTRYPDRLPEILRKFCPVALSKMCEEDRTQFDLLAENIDKDPNNKLNVLKQMLALIHHTKKG